MAVNAIMKNLFDTPVYNEAINRLNRLSPESQRQWGKMDVAQMLAHVSQSFKVPLTKSKLPRIFIGRILGPLFKSKLYNDIPWKKNLPTSPDFKIRDSREFEAEKENLRRLVETFYTWGPEGITKHPHPFFGSFTPEQWGQSMYKHLDHHFQQFGV